MKYFEYLPNSGHSIHHRVSSVWLGPAIIVLLATHCAAQTNDQRRIWRTSDGESTVDATLVDYNYDSQLVTLDPHGNLPPGKPPWQVTSQGEHKFVQIAVKQLSAGDRYYILKRLRQRNPQSHKTPPQPKPHPESALPEVAGGNLSTGDAMAVKRNANSTSRRLAGIDWQPSINHALRIAKGSEVADDDRPVMWFRVLGDLTGFM